MIKPSLATWGRVAATCAAIVVAAFAAQRLWARYETDPWTRDGRVRADVVQIAPDVSGLVSQVSVVNDQEVRRGDVLFVVDRERYTLALKQAQAAVAAQRATLAQAQREAARNKVLGDLVAHEGIEQSQSRVEAATAALEQAVAARDVAVLNLERTMVRAPTDGYLADLTLRAGDYVSPGRPVLGLIDRTSYRVEGYFEETKLPRLKVGQAAQVKLMGESRALRGHVQSIATGIEDRDRQPGATLLPNVNPTFNWIRLAQRVPVRITLDELPANGRLVVGRTASVSIEAAAGTRTGS